MIEIVAYTINLSTVTEFKLCLTSKEATLKIRSISAYSDVLGLKLNLVHQNNLTSLRQSILMVVSEICLVVRKLNLLTSFWTKKIKAHSFLPIMNT